MFEELTINIRTGIVARAYTYRPRIMAESAAAPTGRAAAQQAALASPALAGNGGARGAAAVAPPEARNLGRNDPCWCGSGKKYKDCHWDRDHLAAPRVPLGSNAAAAPVSSSAPAKPGAPTAPAVPGAPGT